MSTDQTPFRPPATPLVTCDPYFSIWSFRDRLNEDTTRHWTGAPHPLTAWLRIDGTLYRVMGDRPSSIPPMQQKNLDLTPTQTVYTFEDAGVELTLRFTTPALPDDLGLLSSPFTYITWEVRSSDGQDHSVAFYFEASSELTVNSWEQKVIGSRVQLDGITALRLGSFEQPILGKAGDNLRIDWGYLYVAAPASDQVQGVVNARRAVRQTFLETGELSARDDLRQPRPVRDHTLVAAYHFDMGTVGQEAVSSFLVLAYDDIDSIEYLRRPLKGYWRKNGKHIGDLLQEAVTKHDQLLARCDRFDAELTTDLIEAGGEKYARIATLAYGQCVAAHKLVADLDGTPLLFSKENFSNGCIATVDVTYPTSPFFLLFNPELLKAATRPILEYAGLDQWPFPFAPHDLGTYPLANGQVYGGGQQSEENQMPVEESGNMLIMVSAVCLMEGSPDFALPYQDLLRQWADYLEAWGFDPENQLCTDDFAGHLAHNANLSVKAIVALGAYAKLCALMGDREAAAHYDEVARRFVQEWLTAADDGDHYRLAFDKPGTWSQKYNLVWDLLLELNLFPKEVIQKELAYYKTQQNAYGLPLDNRSAYTKVDWIVWTATLADNDEDFAALIDPLYRFVQETPSRVPLTDWYWTTDARQVGFQARPVVGGVFIKILRDPQLREKYRAAASTR